MRAQSVYLLEPSIDDGRPVIDFTRAEHTYIDWLRVARVLDHELDRENFPEVAITVDDEGALDWHFYMVPGTPGILSGRAVALLKGCYERCFDLLPATLNGEPWHFLMSTDEIDCLDREKSTFRAFPEPPLRIMTFTRLVFRKAVLGDPCVFCIPEMPDLFATGLVRDLVEREGLRGFRFLDVGAEAVL